MKRRHPAARVTLRVGKDVLSWFRERARSAGGGDYRLLMTKALTDRVGQEHEAIVEEIRNARAYERARKRALRDLRKPRNLGTFGKATWTRDALHERHPNKKAK